jgi:hypothetical protein
VRIWRGWIGRRFQHELRGAINNVEWIRAGDFPTLFQAERDLRNEINRRAWAFLKALGYEWYKTNSISVVMVMRGKVDIIQIKADVEQNHVKVLIESEVTLTVFEMTLSGKIVGV